MTSEQKLNQMKPFLGKLSAWCDFLEFISSSSLFMLLFSNKTGTFESICRFTAHKHMLFKHEVLKNTWSCQITGSCLLQTLHEQRNPPPTPPRAARTQRPNVWKCLQFLLNTSSGENFSTFSKSYCVIVQKLVLAWRTYENFPRGLQGKWTKWVRTKLPAQTSSCPSWPARKNGRF